MLFIFAALFPPCSLLLPLGLSGPAVVSKAPSSPVPSEVSSVPLCPDRRVAGSAGTGRAGFSRVLGRVQPHLAEQSPTVPSTASAADASSLSAVRHLRGKRAHPVPSLAWERSHQSQSHISPCLSRRRAEVGGAKSRRRACWLTVVPG